MVFQGNHIRKSSSGVVILLNRPGKFLNQYKIRDVSNVIKKKGPKERGQTKWAKRKGPKEKGQKSS